MPRREKIADTRLGGEDWEVYRTNLKHDRGNVSPAERIIRIDRTIKGKELVEVAIHEAIHAQQWHLDEDYVENFALELTDYLDDLGLLA